MSIGEIETAISNLPPEDFARIRDWFFERDNLVWDKQITNDFHSGRLNFLLEELEADVAAGRSMPLDEVIGDS